MPHPEFEAAGWGGQDGVFSIDEDLGVLFGGHLVDEQIIFSYRGGVMGNEALVPVKQFFAIG